MGRPPCRASLTHRPRSTLLRTAFFEASGPVHTYSPTFEPFPFVILSMAFSFPTASTFSWVFRHSPEDASTFGICTTFHCSGHAVWSRSGPPSASCPTFRKGNGPLRMTFSFPVVSLPARSPQLRSYLPFLPRLLSPFSLTSPVFSVLGPCQVADERRCSTSPLVPLLSLCQ